MRLVVVHLLASPRHRAERLDLDARFVLFDRGGSLKRANMRYSVMPMGVGRDKLAMLCAVVRQLSADGKRGIVFTTSRLRTVLLSDASEASRAALFCASAEATASP